MIVSLQTFVLVDLHAQWDAVSQMIQPLTATEKLAWLAARGEIHERYPGGPLVFRSRFGLQKLFRLDEQGNPITFRGW